MAINENLTRKWNEQGDILAEILELYREIEEKQKEINHLVLENRRLKIVNPSFEYGFTESIESYHVNL